MRRLSFSWHPSTRRVCISLVEFGVQHCPIRQVNPEHSEVDRELNTASWVFHWYSRPLNLIRGARAFERGRCRRWTAFCSVVVAGPHWLIWLCMGAATASWWGAASVRWRRFTVRATRFGVAVRDDRQPAAEEAFPGLQRVELLLKHRGAATVFARKLAAHGRTGCELRVQCCPPRELVARGDERTSCSAFPYQRERFRTCRRLPRRSSRAIQRRYASRLGHRGRRAPDPLRRTHRRSAWEGRRRRRSALCTE